VETVPFCVTLNFCSEVIAENSMSFLAEFWKFLRVRKRFWLVPLLVMMLVFGALLVLAESSAVAPFIYTLF
jgi:hypothetical protein